jgi:hypothetical protein
MRKIVPILYTLFCVLAISASLARANSDENVTRRRPDAVVPQIMEIRAEGRDIVQEFRSNIAENHANRLQNRFGFYFSRLDNIIARFQRRLDALKGEGRDVTSIQTKLDAAKSKLAEAKAKGGEAIAAFRAIDPAKFSEQRTQRLAARDLASAARKLFVETHNLLKEAVRLLKALK